MATRKKTSRATESRAPRVLASPEAMLQSAVWQVVESDWDDKTVVSVVASRDRSHFSDGQRGERNQIDFSYEHPSSVVVTQQVVLDLSRLSTLIAKSFDYEGQEAAVEAMFMRPDFPRLVAKCAETAVVETLKGHEEKISDSDELSNEIYDAVSAASSTR